MSGRQFNKHISKLDFFPLTSDRWDDFTRLFGERGACGGCWCMWMRLTRSVFEQQKGELNKNAIKEFVDSGNIPGLLAYQNDEPIGWISVAPREEFSVLQRSRILKPLDDKPVWSVACFFIDKKYRNQGLSVRLLQGAIEYVKQKGGEIVEGYPVEPKKDRMPAAFAWTGLASAFLAAGFSEKERRSETRPIMRYLIN